MAYPEQQLFDDLRAAIQQVDFSQARRLLREHESMLRNLRARNPVSLARDEIPLGIIGLACEVYDYHDENLKAKMLIEAVGKGCERELEDVRRHKVNHGHAKLYKHQISALLQYGYVFYRNSNYEEAEKKWKLCRDAVIKLRSEEYPLFGTQSRIDYSLGLIHRQRNEYFLAKQEFANAIDAGWSDLEFESAAGKGTAKASLIEFRAAKCLSLGLGWVCYTESQLHIARPLLAAARTLLVGKRNEHIIRSYVDVIYASVLLAEGTEQRTTAAIQILEKAHNLFAGLPHDQNGWGKSVLEDCRHASYAIQAACTLAHAYLRKARFNLPSQLEDYARAQHFAEWVCHETVHTKPRWFANANTVLSRLYVDQGKADLAMTAASHVLDTGNALNLTFLKVDGLICRGEVHFAQQKYPEAANDFKDALERGCGNPKVAAVCHLHLSRTYARNHNIKKAEEHFKSWRDHTRIENAFIQTLAKIVEREIDAQRKKAMSDFTISHDTGKIDAKKKEQEFYEFLCDWALLRSGNNEKKAAELLDVSQETFTKYKERAGIGKAKASIKASGK